MTFEIAVGSADDVQRMAQWATDEGWNPGKTDAHAFFATDPGGFLVGRLDGEPVTGISVVKYGPAFGFLGFYIARPQVRGNGYGIQIWNTGMKRLAGRNVGLDGVPAQQANYRKSGFRLAWNNVRYEGAPVTAKPPTGVELLDARSIAFDKLAGICERYWRVDTIDTRPPLFSAAFTSPGVHVTTPSTQCFSLLPVFLFFMSTQNPVLYFCAASR